MYLDPLTTVLLEATMTSVAQSQSAIKTGAIRKGDQSVLLVSSYGKVERKLALDASRQSQSSVIGLFSRNHVGSLPSIRPGFSTEMQRYLSSVGLLKYGQSIKFVLHVLIIKCIRIELFNQIQKRYLALCCLEDARMIKIMVIGLSTLALMIAALTARMMKRCMIKHWRG